MNDPGASGAGLTFSLDGSPPSRRAAETLVRFFATAAGLPPMDVEALVTSFGETIRWITANAANATNPPDDIHCAIASDRDEVRVDLRPPDGKPGAAVPDPTGEPWLSIDRRVSALRLGQGSRGTGIRIVQSVP